MFPQNNIAGAKAPAISIGVKAGVNLATGSAFGFLSKYWSMQFIKLSRDFSCSPPLYAAE
jgi:hypothetical protein